MGKDQEQIPGRYDPTSRVSYSSMTLHRQCPQAWKYRYIDDLVSVSERHAADLGTWWHFVRACDSIHRGLALGSLLESPARLSAAPDLDLKDAGDGIYHLPSGQSITAKESNALTLAEAWWRKLPSESKDSWIESLGEAMPERLSALAEAYRARWNQDLDRESPLLVEAKVHVPLPGTSAEFSGIVDLVYRDEARGLVVVRDHKTSSSLPGADAEADLADSQLHLYGWAVGKVLSKRDPEFRVDALSYDRVRSAKPKEPSLTQSGNLSKSVRDYDLATYLRFAAGPDGNGVPWGEPDEYVKSGKNAGKPKWGIYTVEDEEVARLSSPAALSLWHQRTLTPLNKRIVRTHVRSMAYSQRRAEETVEVVKDEGEAPRNFHRWTCRTCDFKRLCAAQLTGGPEGDYPPEDYGLVKNERSKND